MTRAMTHAEALAGVRALNSAATGVNPLCEHQALDHGQRRERAVVLFHGLTSCPAMYGELARDLFDRGVNVLLPRLPRHGLADRMTDEQRLLTAEELKATGSDAVDIASGLGEKVTVAGISLGGVLTGWLAQTRADIDRAVLVAPLFAAPAMPEWLSDFGGFAADRIPNQYLWWDPKAKAAIEGPPYSYPRFSSRAYGEMLRLAAETKRAARKAPPGASEIRLVVNANDPAVNNAATLKLGRAWRDHGAKVSVYEFPKSMGLFHDIISPQQRYARTAEVYPALIDQILGPVGWAG